MLLFAEKRLTLQLERFVNAAAKAELTCLYGYCCDCHWLLLLGTWLWLRKTDAGQLLVKFNTAATRCSGHAGRGQVWKTNQSCCCYKAAAVKKDLILRLIVSKELLLLLSILTHVYLSKVLLEEGTAADSRFKLLLYSSTVSESTAVFSTSNKDLTQCYYQEPEEHYLKTHKKCSLETANIKPKNKHFLPLKYDFKKLIKTSKH